ncbi:hypothetical protein [Cohnella sp. GCM10027633]|uniref:hypothetical protein n=1 Tax=unclassified Cohnella TaxID=2636738 RepID=UPI00363D0DE2
MLRTLGKTAIYEDKEYEFIDLDDGTFALISNSIDDMKLGFEQVNKSNSRFLKKVRLEELAFVFHKYTEVTYQGDLFIASVIENNTIMLYTRDVPLGKKHNMNIRDKDEYYLYVELKDIDEINQKWKPLTQYNKKE